MQVPLPLRPSAPPRPSAHLLHRLTAPPPLCPSAPPPPCTQAPRAVLGRSTYLRAAVWLIARLAEGLHHAHQRGVLHRDIKPSNILIGDDGQPLLLDFNLSQNDFGEQAQASLGGTVAYMAPEHLRALAGRDPALARTVDQRSDIYSLGVVLFEMLAGRRPFVHHASYAPLPVLVQAMAVERGRGSPSLRAVRPDAPWSLESIVKRCLSPDPAHRYQHADELAEDLRRFLDDQPLCHAPELSQVERLEKWVRRHPRLTSTGSISAAALVLLVGTGVALATNYTLLVESKEQVAVAHARDHQRTFDQGLERALFFVNTTTQMEDHARQGRTACEETLGLYGVLDGPDWQQHPDWQRLSADDRRRQAGDVRELLLLLAGARVRLAPGDRPTLSAALDLLNKAAAIPDLEPCRALWEDRADYLDQLGDEPAAAKARADADALQPHTARDFYLLAMTRARDRDFTGAITLLNEAVRKNPRHYWAWLQRGICHKECNDPVLAASDFASCIGLKPDFAWGYFNRAYALALCGRRAEALDDYTSALRFDPEFASAYVNRGLLRLDAGEAGPALEDFQAALDRGHDDAALHSARGMALERLQRHDEADAAFASARQRAADGPRDARLRQLCAYGFAIAGRAPDKAREAFRAVLRDDENNAEALYGCGMLLDRPDQPDKMEEALGFFNDAIAIRSTFVEARRFRALLLARLHHYAAAAAEIQVCLSLEQASGATRYAAACVAALTVPSDEREADRAVELLSQAFQLGYGRDKAATDPDLKAVRSHPGFRRLVQPQR